MAESERARNKRIRRRYDSGTRDAVQKAADEFKSEVRDTFREIETRERKMKELLVNRQRTQDEAVRAHIDSLIESHQTAVEDLMKSARSGAASYWDLMSRDERKALMRRIKEMQELEDTTSDAIRRVHGDFDDMLGDMDQSLTDTMGQWSDKLRDLADTFNLSAIANALEENVDSYVKNLREMRTATGSWFDEKAFSESVSSMVKDLSSFNRNEASDFYSELMRSYSFKDVEEASMYAKELGAATKAFGNSISEFENIVWRDEDAGANGRLLRNVTNIASALEDNENLYASAADIVGKINENINNIYTLSRKDFKRQKSLINSVAAIEAFQESAANDGLSDFSEKLVKWATSFEATNMEDESFRMTAAMLGYNIKDFQAAIRDPEQLDDVISRLYDVLEQVDDTDTGAYRLKQIAEVMGFDSAEAFASILNTSKEDAVASIREAVSSTQYADQITDDGVSLATEKEGETVGAIEAMKNELSLLWGPVADWFGELDVSMANLANLAIVGSTILDAGGKILDFIGGGGTAANFISKISEGIGNVLSGGLGVISKVVTSAAGAAPGAALFGAGIYGISQGKDALRSSKEELDDRNYGRSAAYAADSAALVGAGATAAVAGGIGISAGIGAAAGGATAGAAALAGLAAIPGFGWVAAGVLAVGLGTKAILDNTKAVNGFAEGIEDARKTTKESLKETYKARKDELLSIKNFARAADGTVEDLNEAKNRLISEGVSQEIAERFRSTEELINFTQELINATQASEGFANAQVDKNVDEAKSEMKRQFTDKDREAWIDAALESVIGGKDAKKGSAEWDAAASFFEDLADTMEEGDAKDEFIKMYKEALNNHGGLSVDEFRGLMGDKGAGASWRALWSTNLDLKKSYFDNATDYSALNQLNDLWLGGNEDLYLDSSRVDALTAGNETIAELSGAFQTWNKQKDKDSDIAQQMKYEFESLLSGLRSNESIWDNLGNTQSEIEGWAKKMGIEGYAKGLSFVPNDGLAYLHTGEAVLTKDQAGIVRGEADGGIEALSRLNDLWLNSSEGKKDEGYSAKAFREVMGSLGFTSVEKFSVLLSEPVIDALSDVKESVGLVLENDIETTENDMENEEQLLKEFKKNGIFGKFMNNLKSGSFAKTLVKGLFGSNSKITQTLKKFMGGSGTSGGIFGGIAKALGLGGSYGGGSYGGSSGGSYGGGSYGGSGSGGGSTFSGGGSSLAEFVSSMTSSHEGNYGSINYNDNGAVSIGKMQWHAGNAKNLLNMIRDADQEGFNSIISQYGAQDLAASLASGDNWGSHIVQKGSAEAQAIKALLETTVGQSIQEQQRVAWAQSYIDKGQKLGLTDQKALAFLADMYNQYGMYNETINNKIIPQAIANGGTLDAIYNATMNNFSQYHTRRQSIYDTLKDADFSGLSASDTGSGGAVAEVPHTSDWIQIAMSQKGYKEGANNDTPFGTWIGSPNQPWCAAFVSWALAQAGVSGLKSASTGALMEQAKSMGVYRDKSSYIPGYGDVFFEKSNGAGHTGFVISSDSSGTFKTIEGNASDMVKSVTRHTSDRTMTGFAALGNKGSMDTSALGASSPEGMSTYAVGTPWVPEDQVALIHEGEAIVPAESNPLNHPTPYVDLPESAGNDDVVEALQWTVSRLEAKLDRLIDAVSSNKRVVRRAEELQRVFAPVKT